MRITGTPIVHDLIETPVSPREVSYVLIRHSHIPLPESHLGGEDLSGRSRLNTRVIIASIIRKNPSAP
jgi:hypothetical protein